MTELYIVSLLLLVFLLFYIKRRVKAYQREEELNRREITTRKKRASVADVYGIDTITKETAERISAFNNDYRREYKIIGTDKKWSSPVKPISQETGDVLLGLLENMKHPKEKK